MRISVAPRPRGGQRQSRTPCAAPRGFSALSAPLRPPHCVRAAQVNAANHVLHPSFREAKAGEGDDAGPMYSNLVPNDGFAAAPAPAGAPASE